MIVHFYITMVPGADRPYVSNWPPNPEARKALKAKGGKVFLNEVVLPGWDRGHDDRIESLAQEVTDGIVERKQ